MGDVRFGQYDPPDKGYSVINTTPFSLFPEVEKDCVKVDRE